ncbi:MAG: Gfo/Idh/MocA family oxidoreductase [Candidatus Rokubacteria bacterium]|nr:Gfo/Idh/MocA family oxidoreductase [Candidatus Rokubacteria bacterium]
MGRLRIMVCGAGFFGRKWLEVIRARPDCEIAGIVSRTPARLDEARRELGLDGVAGYASLDEAVARAHADAVVVALPQMLHRETIVRALRAGWHVLTEKPLAMTMDEARAILDASCARRDRVVMVNQNFRWRPHTLAFARGVREGLIGRPAHLMLECRQQIRRTTVEAWRERMVEPYLLDFSIHHFDLLRYLTGDEPHEVVAMSFRPSWSWFAGNSAAAAIVTMASGLVVSYTGMMVAQGLETPQEGLITLTGELGTLHLDGASCVSLLGQGEPRPIPGEPVPESDLGRGLAQFVDAIRTGRQPETHLGDNVRSFALLIAAVESARARRAVRVDDLLPDLARRERP